MQVNKRRQEALCLPERAAADETFPLELKVPNAETRAAMQESRAMMASRKVREALTKI